MTRVTDLFTVPWTKRFMPRGYRLSFRKWLMNLWNQPPWRKRSELIPAVKSVLFDARCTDFSLLQGLGQNGTCHRGPIQAFGSDWWACWRNWTSHGGPGQTFGGYWWVDESILWREDSVSKFSMVTEGILQWTNAYMVLYSASGINESVMEVQPQLSVEKAESKNSPSSTTMMWVDARVLMVMAMNCMQFLSYCLFCLCLGLPRIRWGSRTCRENFRKLLKN